MFFVRCPPDFPRGVSVHRGDTEPDDEVRPSGMRIGGNDPGRDDGDVRYRIVAR